VLFAVSSFADYRTPGTGEVYTLDLLADLAPDVLQETGYGLLLTDKLIIAPNDALEVVNETLYFAGVTEVTDQYTGALLATYVSVLVVEGGLQADNWTLKSIPEVILQTCSHGLIVGAPTQEGAAAAVIQDCTFERLGVGLAVRGNGKANVERVRFNDCFYAGVNTYMNGELILKNSTSLNSLTSVSSPAKLQMAGCRTEGAGLTLSETLEGTAIVDNSFLGDTGIGLNVNGDVKGSVRGNQFGGFEYGAVFTGLATGLFDRNVFWGAKEVGIVCDASATPTLRRNQVILNCVRTLTPQGQIQKPAIFTMEGAQPDFGTVGDPGLNVIRYNGGLAFYHAGTETISAVGNLWGRLPAAKIEDLIYHQPDDVGDADGNGIVSGLVIYQPFCPVDEVPGSADIDWSGRIDHRDLFMLYRDWHQTED